MSPPSSFEIASPPARTISVRRPALRQVCIAVSLAFLLALGVGLAQGVKPFYYDSGEYWSLGGAFVIHGDFSLLNFANPLRGYLLPLIDHGLQGVAAAFGWRASAAVNVFAAACFALIGAVLAPRVAELTWLGRRWGIARRLALTALLVVFWRGFLSYPLSDFAALAFMFVALVACAKPESPPSMALAGLAAGAALDARPSYSPLLLVVPVLAALAARDVPLPARAGRPRRIGAWIAMIAAFAAISLPQTLIAHRYFSSWSFVPGSAAHLESLQLSDGMRLQRYETFVGAGHAPQMNYEDPSGARLLASQPGGAVSGLGQYFGLIADHPGTMVPLLASHVINGLDQRYPTPYVERLDTGSQRWLRVAGLLLVAVALLRLTWPSLRRGLGPTRWRYPLALLACCITAVPSAMETRFMLPVYVLVYLIVLAPKSPRVLSETAPARRRLVSRAAVLVGGGLLAALVFTVTSDASSHLRLG